MHIDLPRLMLVGEGSGVGKTTITCALLLALKKRGLSPAAFKCGPDYVDPMFHSKVLGIPSCNLDLFLCGEDGVKYLLGAHAQYDVAIMEGAMGIYDGLGKTADCSSNQIATLTITPEVLVVQPKGQSLSLAAKIHGYLHFLHNNIQGIIFNQTTAQVFPHYKSIVEDQLGLPVYGYLPPLPEAHLGSRKLGLIPPEELQGLRDKLEILADTASSTIDLDGLLEIARTSAPVVWQDIPVRKIQNVNIAVARDRAFCFYYEASLDILRQMGTSLVFFSPLTDSKVPDGVDGLFIGGGYLEEHAEELSANKSMLGSVQNLLNCGLPTIAEGNGYVYLCQSFQNLAGQRYPMVGVIDSSVWASSRLQRFGYATLTAEQDTFLCAKGTVCKAHEFHYSDSSNNGQVFTAAKADGRQWNCMHSQGRLFAGYPQVHFVGNMALAEGFIRACASFQDNKLVRSSSVQ